MRACPSVDVSKHLRRLVCLSKRKKENPPTAHAGEGVRGTSGELTGILLLACTQTVKRKMSHSPHCFSLKMRRVREHVLFIEKDKHFQSTKKAKYNFDLIQNMFVLGVNMCK